MPVDELRPPSPARGRAVRLLAVCGLAGALALAVTGCSLGGGADEPSTVLSSALPADGSRLATPPELQSDALVDLTVYLRKGEGPAAHLVPVVREVPVGDDLPRRALELLIDGPTDEDTSLEPPLPPSTEVNSLAVEGGVAHVDLSAEVLTDARDIGDTPVDEALALGALTNTLTEFASIERVVLTVDGEDDGAIARFWGGWGLPDVLVRDESLVGERLGEGDGVADLASFSAETQEVGSAGVEPVRVTGIRVRDKLTYTRFVLELSGPTGASSDAGDVKVPAARVAVTGREVVLELSTVVDLAGPAGERVEEGPLAVDEGRYDAARVEFDERSGTLRMLLSTVAPATYRLHALPNPTRVVLDVKK